jgi:hypothetical protein
VRGLGARTADLVDRHRRDPGMQSAVEACLPRAILSQPACTTLPMTISSTCCGSMPARRTASATTFAPSSAQAPLEFSDGESGLDETYGCQLEERRKQEKGDANSRSALP